MDSLLHPQALLVRDVLARSERNGRRLILIDDEENIAQALRAGIALRSVFHSDDATLTADLRQRLSPDTPIYGVAWRTCKKLFGNGKISRVFAIAERPPPLSLNALLPVTGDVVVLDHLGISGNIGAIVRTSAAMRVGGIVLMDTDTADIFDRRVIRASRGHLFALRVATASAEELVGFCSRHALSLVVAEPRAGMHVGALSSISRPLVIAFGGEKGGCSPMLRNASNLRIGIRTTSAVESLNVAAAAAITLYCRYPFNAAAASGHAIPASLPSEIR